MAERRYTVVFMVAVVIAVVATYGVFRALRTIQQVNHVAQSAVIIAARDIPEGHAINKFDIGVSLWPAASTPAGAFSSADSLFGRVTRVPVYTGEPIVPGRLAPSGTGPGIEVKITPGKRAMAIRVDEVAGVSGLVQPNSRVNVMVSMRDENGANGKRVAKLFMENMRVLSVGTHTIRGADGSAILATTATLEVDPEQAERLAIAVGSGSIQLILRGYGDPDSIRTRGATAGDVLSQLRVAAVAPAPVADPPLRRHVAPPPPRPAAPAPVLPVAAPPPPRRRDSVTIQIFRAGKQSQAHFAPSADTAAADSAAH